jgi:hypothetical protein
MSIVGSADTSVGWGGAATSAMSISVFPIVLPCYKNGEAAFDIHEPAIVLGSICKESKKKKKMRRKVATKETALKRWPTLVQESRPRPRCAYSRTPLVRSPAIRVCLCRRWVERSLAAKQYPVKGIKMMTPTGLTMILRADSLSRCRKRETKSSKYVGQTERTLRTRGYALVHIQ